MNINPGTLYLTGEDHLRVSSFGSLAGVTLAIEGRLVDDTGCVIPIAEVQTPNTDRTVKQSLITLARGWLSNLQARVTSGTPKRGQCFVIVELVRGRLGNVQPLGVLLQGYVSSSVALAWPGVNNTGPLEGPGVLRSVTGTDPAANVEISETVPTGARWRLLALRALLVTDGNVATRDVRLIIDDGATILAQLTADQTQAASLSISYSAVAGAPIATPRNTGSMIALPADLRLPSGSRFRTLTANMQATDNWGAPQYLVEEWIEP